MTIYILRAFATEYKYWGEADVVGYYTNKRALWRAIKKHARTLGLVDCESFRIDFARGRFGGLGAYMDKGDVEVAPVNEYCSSIYDD